MDCKKMIIHFEDLHQHVQFRIAKAHGVQNPIDFKSFFKLNPIMFTEFCKKNNNKKKYYGKNKILDDESIISSIRP
jgi:hypothetical protein